MSSLPPTQCSDLRSACWPPVPCSEDEKEQGQSDGVFPLIIRQPLHYTFPIQCQDDDDDDDETHQPIQCSEPSVLNSSPQQVSSEWQPRDDCLMTRLYCVSCFNLQRNSLTESTSFAVPLILRLMTVCTIIFYLHYMSTTRHNLAACYWPWTWTSIALTDKRN